MRPFIVFYRKSWKETGFQGHIGDRTYPKLTLRNRFSVTISRFLPKILQRNPVSPHMAIAPNQN